MNVKGNYMLRVCMSARASRFVRNLSSAAGLLLAVVVSQVAVAAESGSPEETIERFNTAILQAMNLDKSDGIYSRYQIMHDAVGDAFDMKVLARATINRVHWRTWSPEQQTAYVTTLRRYQSAVLADRFESGNDISFVIDRSIDAPRGTKVVETRIIRPEEDEEDIGLDYRMVKRSDHWRIIDVYLDSKISEVAMRRSEYSQVVRDQGYDALITALEKQTGAVLGPDYKAVQAASAVTTN